MRHHNYDQWLKQNMPGKYQQVDAARKDILNAMVHYKDLRPKAEQFTYNDGSRKNLINLNGTIPVSFRGTTYNIPVAIWIQEPHPQTPPLCFVRPTNTMQVRQGKHVDANGRVYLPYLNEWRARSHSILGCIQVMITVFSEEPPVYSKQAAPARPAPVPYPGSSVTQPPYPGYPPVQGPPSTNYRPNFNTPYPPVSQSTPYPPAQPAAASQSTPYPPYPGYPPSTQVGMPSTNTPYPVPPAQTANLQRSQHPGVDDSMIKASMLTAANDKIKRRLKDTLTQAEGEKQLLKQTESELRTGKEKLDTILNKLENEIAEADTNIVLLGSKNEELERELDRLKKQEKFNADEAVMATTPVFRQIVNSFAEEQALEDTIYYLGEALHKSVVDTDTFLKHVRALSRQQFVLRAVIQKARKTAGLASIY